MTPLAKIALTAATLIALSSAPATASTHPVNEGGDNQPCATYAEFQALTLGMPRGQVRRVLDTDGQRMLSRSLDAPGIAGRVRAYPECVEPGTSPGGLLYIGFSVRPNPAHGRALSMLWS